MASHLSPLKPLEAKPSSRKLGARHQLECLAVRVSDGTDYGLQEALRPNVTLSDAREALKGLSQSLAQLVVAKRQTS